MNQVNIVPATKEDFSQILPIFRSITSTGDSYIYQDDFTDQNVYDFFLKDTVPFVAKIDNKIVGFYIIRQNRIGRGSHICNASYMVSPEYQNNKIGRLMGEHSLVEAKKLGYKAMQFNIVVSTNLRAVSLWQSLGFKIIGTIPQGFNHKEKGLVDAYIMHRFL